MNENMNKTENTLKDSILKDIEEKNLCPRSKLFFMCKECLVWVFWGLSVVVGALSVAVTMFVMSYQQYALYEATHENFFTFVVGALPYLWFGIFFIMAVLAVTNLRKTKRGYKYTTWQILGSSLILSLAGGAALQLFGVGYSLDHMLGEEIKMYMSQEKAEKKLWLEPEDGRLLGIQTSSATSTIVFMDELGRQWSVNVDELAEADKNLLGSEGVVRMLGSTTDSISRQFHACGVFPWMLDERIDVSVLSNERQAFIERVYDHMHKAEERLRLLEEETFMDKEMGICAEIAAVKRVEETMH